MWAGLEDRGFDVRGTVADPNFLRFFTFPLIDGSQPPELTPGSVYITESFAQKLFGTTDVIGRTLKIYYKWVEGEFHIGGILRDQPVATSGEFTFDLLINHEGITRGLCRFSRGIEGSGLPQQDSSFCEPLFGSRPMLPRHLFAPSSRILHAVIWAMAQIRVTPTTLCPCVASICMPDAISNCRWMGQTGRSVLS